MYIISFSLDSKFLCRLKDLIFLIIPPASNISVGGNGIGMIIFVGFILFTSYFVHLPTSQLPPEKKTH